MAPNNIYSNRCSRSSFIEESPREYLQQVMPIQQMAPIQQLQQYIPQQRQVFVESPRIQYQPSIQYNNPIQQYNHYSQQPQKYILKSMIVPKDNRSYQNNYYEPTNTFVQECYC